jgi:hypothetical protein
VDLANVKWVDAPFFGHGLFKCLEPSVLGITEPPIGLLRNHHLQFIRAVEIFEAGMHRLLKSRDNFLELLVWDDSHRDQGEGSVWDYTAVTRTRRYDFVDREGRETPSCHQSRGFISTDD